jgi:ABC-type molybdate transport system substrate-binding protein
MNKQQIYSTAIAITSLILATGNIPGLQKNLKIVAGTELNKPLEELAVLFEQKNPSTKVELNFQGSQDMVNNFVDQKSDFKPTVLIPASEEIISELKQRLTNQNQTFIDNPQPIAKTVLVGIAWPERGKVLFPRGRFQWERVENAMQAGNWAKIGGQNTWGSFDFITTDPTRSNSGQLTLSLWAQSKTNNLNDPAINELFSTVKKSVYLPPRSTDILLQEFIARGPNDADVATVYESIALSRWQESQTSKGQPYQIYYLNPTIETTATAVIVGKEEAATAKKFLAFLREPESQKIFIKHGFRPVIKGVDIQSVSDSPWQKNIPGAEVNPRSQISPAPDSQTLGEIKRLWERQ